MHPAIQQKLQHDFEGRVGKSRKGRLEKARSYLKGDFAKLAPTEQMISRLETRGLKDQAQRLRRAEEELQARGAGSEIARRLRDEANLIIREAVVGSDDMQSVQFLHRGSRVAMAVGRILTMPNRGINGTGFLISPRLLMTNNHVLASELDASNNIVEFLYGDSPTESPVVFRFVPGEFFRTSRWEELDCTVVAVEPVNAEQAKLERFGWCALGGQEGTIQVGERVNIIHHPRGAVKQVSIRDNFVADEIPQPNPRYWLYASDTRRGSSGSPVFNDAWQVVALHHVGMVVNDPEEVELYRRILQEQGVAGIGSDDPSVALNEGVRMDLILDWVRAQSRSATRGEEDLLREIGTAVPEGQVVVPDPGRGGVSSLKLEEEMATRDSVSGQVTFNVYVGGQPAAAAPGEDVASLKRTLELYKIEVDDQKSIFTALNYLQTHREEQYLPDAATIQQQKQEYYDQLIADVAADNVTPAQLYDALHQLSVDNMSVVSRFPESVRQLESFVAPSRGPGRLVILESDVEYARARAHLYTWVDLQEHRMLQCPYTGAIIAPEQLMLLDLVRELGDFALLPQRYRNNRYLNCEHIVPQSWFKDAHPAGVSDLHHLISADGGANNYRSDCPYRDVDGQGELGPENNPSYIPKAGHKSDAGFFEPARGKHVVARATLYFLIHYRGALDATRYDAAAIETLKSWAGETVPDEYERHRNQTAFEAQGNRNPLIDFPDWLDKIDFTRGIA